MALRVSSKRNRRVAAKVDPQKRTFVSALSMSALCQKRTWARENFANQIANQLCVTARYRATQDEMIASAFLQSIPEIPTRSGLWWLS